MANLSQDPPEQILLRILGRLQNRRGLDFREYRSTFIQRRIQSRFLSVKLKENDYAAYEAYLTTHPEEWDILFDTLTINVTEFFRDPPVWNYIERNVFRPLFSRPHPLTIWSAGCSIGEEPYSLAILAYEMSLLSTNPPPISIYASDVDPIALAKARAGIYTDKSVSTLSEKRIKLFFTKEKDGNYKISPKLASMVRFREHSYINEPFITNCQVILCRNSMIYLAQEAKDKALHNFHKALELGGLLILGASEVLVGNAYDKLFDTSGIHPGILRKSNPS